MKNTIKFASIALVICMFATLAVSCKYSEESDITLPVVDVDFSTEFTIDGSDVKTASGLEYTCEGFNGELFDVSGGKDIDINASSEFNRFTLCYKATNPLKVCVSYELEDNSIVDDIVYLESQKSTFSCLIKNYEKNDIAKAITHLYVEPCEDEAEFMLYDVRLSTLKVSLSEEIYYVQNGRYKLGIYLIQGGGLCYLSDSKGSDMKNKNLLNRHDEGRLVQQSYYGTSDNEEYRAGEFNNSHWCYNPVQGGDQYHNVSRLIDIIKEDHAVYIKCQPQDWSLDGQITPSYMENYYKVYPDRIEVDCRFVDFSGYNHNVNPRDQELPAFYSVSYLDTFTYYGGTNAWQDEEATVKEGLPFWGDPQYSASCCFAMKSAETWCSWTNKSSGYGVGLYTPNCRALLAGRCGDGHSKDAKDGSCSYVAPLTIWGMESYVPFEYSYMLTTGSVQEIRSTFTSYKDFATNACLIKNQ